MKVYYRRVKQTLQSLMKASVGKLKGYGGSGRSYGGAGRSALISCLFYGINVLP